MKDITAIIEGLENTPLILNNFIQSIPTGLLKEHRIKDKWSIHEHVCHLAQAEEMILNRFKAFKNVDFPTFTPYLPGQTVSTVELLDLDMDTEMQRFGVLRRKLVELVRSFDQAIWNKEALHHQYITYNAYILLRHTLMHDHFHMYRIEELWLTKNEYL